MTAAADYTYNIDDITEIIESSYVKPGRYRARLANSDGKLSKAGNPMVEAQFLITEGEQEGSEITLRYPLTITVSQKNGKSYAGGLVDLKKTFTAVGKALPKGFKIPAMLKGSDADEDTKRKIAQAVNSLFTKRLHGVDVDVQVVWDKESPRKDKTTGDIVKDKDGNTEYWTRSFVVGLHKKAAAAQPADIDALEFDLEDE